MLLVSRLFLLVRSAFNGLKWTEQTPAVIAKSSLIHHDFPPFHDFSAVSRCSQTCLFTCAAAATRPWRVSLRRTPQPDPRDSPGPSPLPGRPPPASRSTASRRSPTPAAAAWNGRYEATTCRPPAAPPFRQRRWFSNRWTDGSDSDAFNLQQPHFSLSSAPLFLSPAAKRPCLCNPKLRGTEDKT